MSSFTIKIVAIITMLLDHAGVFLFTDSPELRIIGRLSFPLFAWLIANGAKHTKDIDAYIKRLFVFSIISQLPYLIAHRMEYPNFSGFNVLFTLLLGLIAIKIWEGGLSKPIKYVLILASAFAASAINSDYGAMGVLSIFFFYLYFGDFKRTFLSQLLVYTLVWFPQFLIINGAFDLRMLLQLTGLFSLAIIYVYNSKRGMKTKYLFYIFYPAHFLVFYLLRVLLG